MLSNVVDKVTQAFQKQSEAPREAANNQTPEVSDLDSLKQISALLSKVDLQQKNNIKGKLQLVFDLDEKGYKILQGVTFKHLNTLEEGQNINKAVPSVVFEYLSQLGSVYTFIFTDTQQDNQLGIEDYQVNFVLARYLNAVFQMAKWRYFDDQVAPTGTWPSVHAVIKVAEKLAIMNKKLFLYDSPDQEISLAMLLERGFMLDTLQKENYTPLQFELTERLLKKWSTNPTITNIFKDGEYQFFIHLDNSSRPQRVRSLKHHQDFRYWKTAGIVEFAEDYLIAVKKRQSLDAFDLDSIAPKELFITLFKKLLVDWCVNDYKRQRRKDERKKKSNSLNVCHGLGRVFDFASNLETQANEVGNQDEEVVETITLGGESATSFEVSENYAGSSVFGFESWEMVEESDSGFAVELGTDMNTSVRKGALIGYTDHQQNTVSVAEVRNVKKMSSGRYRVGLNKMGENAIALDFARMQKSQGPASVKAYEVNEGQELLSVAAEYPALLVNLDKAYKLRVIAPSKAYVRAARFKMEVAGQDHLVLAGEVITRSRDWVCFDVIIQTTLN